MPQLEDVVIISACRTAVGKFQGALSDISAPELGALAVREAVKLGADVRRRSGMEVAGIAELLHAGVDEGEPEEEPEWEEGRARLEATEPSWPRRQRGAHPAQHSRRA